MSADDPQIARKMPAFPGVSAAGNPSKLPPGAKSMMGVPAETVNSGAQPGDRRGVRVTDKVKGGK